MVAIHQKRANETPERVIHCEDPATGEFLGTASAESPAQLRSRIERAREAQQVWAKTGFAQRRALLQAILAHVLRHADELVTVAVRDAGKTRENAILGEIWTVVEKLRWTIARAEHHLRPERVSTGLLIHKRARIVYEPLGVIGVICPWNYPLQNVLGPTIPALAAGNAVVVKVSEWTSWSADRIQRIFDEAAAEVGAPLGLVQLVCGDGATGAALVGGGVDKVVFTGSLPNGRAVIRESANGVVPVILELGGKDPLIVCDDADLERALHAVLAGAFIAAGQNCLAAERILVFDAVYDRFLDMLTRGVAALRQGPPLGGERVDVGAITMPAQLEVIEGLVADAVAKGARVIVGGQRNGHLGGQFFQPTLLVDAQPHMAIMQEETFGPVAVVCRVRDEAHAIEVANGTKYALGCTLVTRDRARAQRMAEQIRSGCVSVNDFALTYMAQELPFGGVGGSGFGRLNGRDGLRALCNTKAIIEDRFPFNAPAKLYPVKDGQYELARDAIRLLYAPELAAKWSAAKSLLGRLTRRPRG